MGAARERLSARPKDRSWPTLRHVAAAFLDTLSGTCGGGGGGRALLCPSCFWVPVRPVTLACGHTACRDCLSAAPDCPSCHVRAPPPLPAATNVLIKAAVNKWWAPECQAAKRRYEANNSLSKGLFEDALNQYSLGLELVPTDHLLFISRADLLHRLNRLDEALVDAEMVIKLQPLWPRGHLKRGLILSSLSRYEDALFSFAMYVALDKSNESVKQEFLRALQMLLSSGMPCSSLLGSRGNIGGWWSESYMDLTEDTSESEGREIIEKLESAGLSSFTVFESRRLHILLDRIYEEIEKIKNLEFEGQSLALRAERVAPEDFECVLCYRTLWRPVTTPCGHTYCSMCLDRCLDYSANCPLCMTSLAQYLGTSEKQVTEFIETALLMALPGEYTSRLMAHRQEVSALAHTTDIPVFVCTTAFPTVPCPLFVFEPRYRLMVRRAIDTGKRQFGIAAYLGHQPSKRFAEFGTMLEIKDWLLMSDGCSILSTIGVKRFRVVSKGEKDGYDTAQVQYLIDDPVPPEEMPGLQLLHDQVRERGIRWYYSMPSEIQIKILSNFGEMPALEANWISLNDGPAWTWWIVAILPLGPHLQIGILGTTCLEKRLRAIDKALRHMEEDMSSGGSSGRGADTT